MVMIKYQIICSTNQSTMKKNMNIAYLVKIKNNIIKTCMKPSRSNVFTRFFLKVKKCS